MNLDNGIVRIDLIAYAIALLRKRVKHLLFHWHQLYQYD